MEQLASIPLDFSLDISSLIAGLVFGSIGFWVYRQGRKKENRPLILSGVAMMIYPYFIQGALWNWVVGFFLCGSAYYCWEI